MHIKSDFRAKSPITTIPAAWFNSVANFINGLIGGEGIILNKHDDGTPTIIELNVLSSANDLKRDGYGEGGTSSVGTSAYLPRSDHSHPLNVDDTATPAQTVKNGGSAAAGTSAYYARADHIHEMPALAVADVTGLQTALDAKATQSDMTAVEEEVTTLNTSVTSLTSSVANHEQRIEDLEDGGGGGGGAVSSVNGKTGAVVLTADDVSALDADDIGDSVEAQSDVLDAIADGGLYDTTSGRHEITGDAHYVAATSSSARLLGVAANSSSVTLRDAIGTDMVTYDGENTLNDIIDVDGNLDASHVAFSSASGSKVVETDASGNLTETSKTYARFASAPTSGKFVKTSGTDGTLTTDDFAGLSSTAPSNIANAAAVGTGTTAARADHKHTINLGRGLRFTTNGLGICTDCDLSQNKTITVVTGVTWSGSTIDITTATLNFVAGGLLNSTATGTAQSIPTTPLQITA